MVVMVASLVCGFLNDLKVNCELFEINYFEYFKY